MYDERSSLFEINQFGLFRVLWNSKEFTTSIDERYNIVFDWWIDSIELPSLEQLQTDRYSFYYASVANFESMIDGWWFQIDLSSLHFVSLRDSFKKCDIEMKGEWFEWMIICRCIKWITCCFSIMLAFVCWRFEWTWYW